MRYLAAALVFCFMLTPLEARTHSGNIVKVKVKKHKVKGRKAPKRSKAKVHRVASN
jgi:hypothetical protein